RRARGRRAGQPPRQQGRAPGLLLARAALVARGPPALAPPRPAPPRPRGAVRRPALGWNDGMSGPSMRGRVRRPGARAGYDAWAETYDETPNPLVALDRRHTLGLLRPAPGERILEA